MPTVSGLLSGSVLSLSGSVCLPLCVSVSVWISVSASLCVCLSVLSVLPTVMHGARLSQACTLGNRWLSTCTSHTRIWLPLAVLQAQALSEAVAQLGLLLLLLVLLLEVVRGAEHLASCRLP